jgi:outer membrane protein OmpA-like peptidoglycan-associated protein
MDACMRAQGATMSIRMWPLRSFVALISMVSLSGCAWLRQDAVYNGGPVIPDNTFMLKEMDEALPNACKTEFNHKSIDDWTDAENSGIKLCTRAMLLLVDVRWSRFADEINSAVSTGSTLADITTLGLNISGQLTPAGTTKVLSAIAAGITGSKSIINEDVLYKSSVQTILLQMIKDRALVKKRIIERLDGGHPYGSMFEAALDLYEYDRAGSWNSALLSIQSDIATHSAECRTQLANTQQAIAENTGDTKTVTPPATANTPCVGGTSENVVMSPSVIALIHFDKDQSDVDTSMSEVARALQKVVEICKAKKCKAIDILGKASKDPDIAANRVTSQKRADSVKAALIAAFNSAGVAVPSSISAQGVGYTLPVEGGDEANRVVEISVTQ